MHYSKGLALYLNKPEAEKFFTDEILENYIESFFSTLTNVNFNKVEHVQILKKLAKHRDYLKKNLPKDTALES